MSGVAHIWKSEVNFVKSLLSFHLYMVSGLNSDCPIVWQVLNLLNHFTGLLRRLLILTSFLKTDSQKFKTGI